MLTTGAIIPAAGYSSRMQECKALMEINGKPAIVKIVDNLRLCGISEIIVVTGHWRDRIEPLARKLGCTTVQNENYDSGMFSSAVAGFSSVPDSWDSVVFLPVDIPLVRPETIEHIISKAEDAPVAYPVFNGRRGHPPVLKKEVIPSILSWSGQNGLRGVLDLYEDRSQEVAVADEAILLDMDTPEDYEKLIRLARRREIPSTSERLALEKIAYTPLNVIDHERRVALTSIKLAEIAQQAGLSIDLELLTSGALLHDLCRTEKKHGRAGAALLREHGFSEVASVIENHMDYPYDGTLNEASLLYIADKLTCDNQFCLPPVKMKRMMENFEGRPGAQEGAIRRLKKADLMREDLSRLAGFDVLKAFIK